MLGCLFSTGENQPVCLLATQHQVGQGWETLPSHPQSQNSQLLGEPGLPQELGDLGAIRCKTASPAPTWQAAVQALCNTELDGKKKWKGTFLQVLAGAWPYHTVAGVLETQKGVICCLKSGCSTVKLLLAACSCEFSSSPYVSKLLLLLTQS